MRYKDKNLMTPFAKALVLILVLAMMSTSASAIRGDVIKSITNGPDFYVGDVINYEIKVINPNSAAITIASVRDIFPNGTSEILDTNLFMAANSEKIYLRSYLVRAVDEGKTIENQIFISGVDGDDTYTSGYTTPTTILIRTVPQEDPECNATLRIYGTFGEGPGDLGIKDPRTGLTSENPPYTDPEAPFFPQAEQAPRKDFVTFNPAIMDHNQGWPEINLILPDDTTVQRPKIKVFKRMWYEKEWFKDYNGNGMWDVVMESPWGSVEVVDITDKDTIHDLLKLGYTMRIHNNPEAGDSQSVQGADIYGPAIQQEFAYMMTDSNTMPIMVKAGSRIFIPMAHDAADPYRGLNSFDADGDGIKDTVTIQSEQTLGTDLDLDGNTEAMDTDGLELSNDESLVLVLEDKIMNLNSEVQFFDNTVKLININDLGPASASFKVCDNEGGTSVGCSTVNIGLNQAKYFSRGIENTAASRGPLYVKLVALSSNSATVEVGRQFGEVAANIEANPYWNQKAFIVDQVFYNVVAIKADGDNLKYIVFRQKLPKMPIKLKGEHLEVWDVNETLPEMSPFNMDHEVLVDVQNTWTIPQDVFDKIGPKEARPPLEIVYINESVEDRYKGQLLEIYNETQNTDEHIERWVLEWYQTYPNQYTEFVVPKGDLYLMTLSWEAPEAYIHIWDGDSSAPLSTYTGERVKFWHDPLNGKDLYINGDPATVAGGQESCVLPGDANSDGVVNNLDISFILLPANWGQGAASPANVNGDDVVNNLDISFVLLPENWDKECPEL